MPDVGDLDLGCMPAGRARRASADIFDRFFGTNKEEMCDCLVRPARVSHRYGWPGKQPERETFNARLKVVVVFVFGVVGDVFVSAER